MADLPVVIVDELTSRPVLEIGVPLYRARTSKLGVPPLNHNQRLHHMVRARRVKHVRQVVGLRARAAGIGPCTRLVVTLNYAPGDTRRIRDPMNLTATSKPAIDGLVDAGLVPDDTDVYVHENTPVIHYGPGPRQLWLTVEVTR